MPDTLTPLDEFHLNLIRKYVAAAKAEGPFVKGGLFDMLDQLLAHIDALTALLREAIEAVHQTGSIRDHADPNDKTGWNVHGIETCEDALCVDALAALEPHDA